MGPGRVLLGRPFATSFAPLLGLRYGSLVLGFRCVCWRCLSARALVYARYSSCVACLFVLFVRCRPVRSSPRSSCRGEFPGGVLACRCVGSLTRRVAFGSRVCPLTMSGIFTTLVSSLYPPCLLVASLRSLRLLLSPAVRVCCPPLLSTLCRLVPCALGSASLSDVSVPWWHAAS